MIKTFHLQNAQFRYIHLYIFSYNVEVLEFCIFLEETRAYFLELHLLKFLLNKILNYKIIKTVRLQKVLNFTAHALYFSRDCAPRLHIMWSGIEMLLFIPGGDVKRVFYFFTI